MVKNLPLLIAMLLIGCSTLLIALTTTLPQLIQILLLTGSVVLNVFSMMGLILYIGTRRLNKSL